MGGNGSITDDSPEDDDILEIGQAEDLLGDSEGYQITGKTLDEWVASDTLYATRR